VEETGVPTTCHKSLTNFITSIDIVEMGRKKRRQKIYIVSEKFFFVGICYEKKV